MKNETRFSPKEVVSNIRRQKSADHAKEMKYTPKFGHLDEIAKRKAHRESKQSKTKKQ